MSDDAIIVSEVNKTFRLPLDRSTTLKYRMVHPRSSSRYRDFEALKDINFTVPTGQFLGVVGHNGSGKSTLLKMLAKIYQPSSGSITINGKVSPFLELGVGFNPELTARENIFLNGAVLGLTRRELHSMFDDIISFAELEEHVDQKVKSFSSGMEVRLAFSVAIRANAEILLMDEVLAVGDSRFQLKCFDIFAEHKRQGRTVVLVTHDTTAVEKYCDRAILLDHGRLMADGPAGEVTAQYRRLMGQRNEAEQEHTAAPDPALSISTTGRWGSGELSFSHVTLLDDQAQPHSTFTSGQPLTVHLELDVTQPTDDLTIGFTVQRADGYTLAGTNTFISKVPLQCPPAGGHLTLDYRIPSLNLLGGRYRLTAAAHSSLGSRVYDQLDQAFDFEVTDETGRPGIVELGGEWAVTQSDSTTVSGEAHSAVEAC